MNGSSPDWGIDASDGVATYDDGPAGDDRGRELADDGRWPLTMKEAPHRSASPRRGGSRADVAHDVIADMKAWVAALEVEQDDAKKRAVGVSSAAGTGVADTDWRLDGHNLPRDSKENTQG